MKYVVLIPARGGSKGVIGKNIKELNGKPLIAWSIHSAIECAEISDVFVSTDCPKIQKIAKKYGAKTPFLRPKDISGDEATTESSVIHFIDWCEKNEVVLENIVLMQATSPIRSAGSLGRAIDVFEKRRADSLLTVVKTHSFIWKHIGSPKADYDIFNRPRRQDLDSKSQKYIETGSFYITKKDIYKSVNNRLGGKIEMFEMSESESIDIDSEIDFKLAEFIMKNFKDNS